jgi:hypothetical protein
LALPFVHVDVFGRERGLGRLGRGLDRLLVEADFFPFDATPDHRA